MPIFVCMKKGMPFLPLLIALMIGISVSNGCRSGGGATPAVVLTEPSPDSCQLEPDHRYYISLPKHIHSRQTLSLVIVIDPHGDGLTAMQKFRGALRGFPVIIAGSEKLRNNDDGFEASLKNLHLDLLKKYPADPERVIVAGFSGGARMALYYGLKNPVKGMIMFGAGPGQLPASLQGKQIYAVSGTRDFNFIEQYRPVFSEFRNSSDYVNDYFRGIHTWPPERYLREAVVFCLREDTEPFHSVSHDLSYEFLEESDSLLNTDDLLFAGKALEKAWYFATEPLQQKALLDRISAFENNKEWIATQKELETYLSTEQNTEKGYAEKLSDPNMQWWSGELDSLFARITESGDPVEKDYYYRLKGFLGIYLYSRINQVLRAKDSTSLPDRLLEIYERVEPQSEDLVSFKDELSRLRRLQDPT